MLAMKLPKSPQAADEYQSSNVTGPCRRTRRFRADEAPAARKRRCGALKRARWSLGLLHHHRSVLKQAHPLRHHPRLHCRAVLRAVWASRRRSRAQGRLYEGGSCRARLRCPRVARKC